MKEITEFSEMVEGDFVKITQTDGPVTERLDISGKIVRLFSESERFEVQTNNMIAGLGFAMDDMSIGISKMGKKPNGWGKSKNTEKTPKKREKEVGKREKVRILVENNPKKRFPGLLKLAKAEIGGNEVILSNYIRLFRVKAKSKTE
jgi:hypothetical protein